MYAWLRDNGIPLGGILAGLAFGIFLYLAIDSLRRRPSTLGAGTVPIAIVRMDVQDGAEGADATAETGSRRGVPVRIFSKDGERTVRMTGAGEHPSLPMRRARGFVVALVVTFVVTSLVLLVFYRGLFGRYDHLVALVGAILYWPTPWPGVYAVGVTTLVVPDYIFPMYLAGMAALAVASGLVYRRPPLPAHRRWLALGVVLLYVLVELVLDALFFTVPGSTLRNMALLVRAFTGGMFLALLTFCAAFLPAPQRIRPRFPRDRAAIGRFFGVAALAIAVGSTALLLVTYFAHLRGLLLGFTVLLLLPLLSLELFSAFGRMLYFRELRRRAVPPVELFHPPVSILMPAYNEEEWIADAILHVDRAAAKYPGSVQLIVGNDGSTDRTLELAREGIGRLKHAKGFVVDLPHGGKSNALNGALAIATGEIVIRCDADTFMSDETGFSALIPHFADPEVGGVQGSIHPRQTTGWTRKLRALEIAWNHFLLRPAGMGTRSAEVIDGLFSAFRRAELVEVGGYVPWNGEDTEIAIRFQRLGYRIRIEFRSVAYEDVPQNYDSLRRQRVRWARGILMANGQHYPALLGETPEFGGLSVLFWLLLYVRSGVRSLVYVFLVLLILVLGVPALLDTAVLFVIAIGLRGVPLGVFLVRMNRKDVIPWIPFFPVANVIKQTFRFEAFGTLGPGVEREYV
jgi:cellulose synthase/poly-beta-1,6-N-acetylglucosamine synthase-like glycosyltransferase